MREAAEVVGMIFITLFVGLLLLGSPLWVWFGWGVYVQNVDHVIKFEHPDTKKATEIHGRYVSSVVGGPDYVVIKTVSGKYVLVRRRTGKIIRTWTCRDKIDKTGLNDAQLRAVNQVVNPTRIE